MAKNDKSIEEDEIAKTKIFDQEGSSRAVTSGFYSFTFSIVGSLTLWVFNVIATGNDGLAYFGLISAILGITQIFSTGFGQSFIAKVKAAYVKDPDLALKKASSYFRIYILIGCIIALITFILAIIIPDPFFQINLLMAIPPLLLTYTVGLIGNMISVKNRFDITAFIGSFYGLVVFIVGAILITNGIDAVAFTLIPLFVGLWGTVLTIFFYRRVSPFTIKEMYTKGKTFSEDSVDFVKYTSYSTLTNLESIGVLGNIIVVLTAVSLSIYEPAMRLLSLQIMTIIMTYVIAAKIIIIFFSGPFNIEIAEAVTKNNKKIIQQTITDVGRISSIMGLILLVLLSAGAGHLLRILHLSVFQENGNPINESLLISSQIVFILFAFGQFCYGYSALFGNALIGGGHAKKSAIGFAIALILTIILTPILTLLFGFVGAGITMFITGLILLPYMLIKVKNSLNVKLNFRVLNQIPYLIIVFLLILFYPLEAVLEHITHNNNLPIALIGLVMLLGILFAFIIGIPFFGVMGPGDGKLIRDITKSFNAEKLGNLLIKLGHFFYYLNPLHKKPNKNIKDL
jgi:O-antigen/teichoic acid export membrane protein